MLVLLVGVAVAASAVVVGTGAGRAQDELGTERDALRLVGTQVELAHAVGRHAVVRVAAAAGTGEVVGVDADPADDLDEQLARTRDELDALSTSGVGREARWTRDRLDDAGERPDDLAELLVDHNGDLFEALLGRPPQADRRVTGREAALRSLLELSVVSVNHVLDVVYAEQATGVADHDPGLTAALRTWGAPPRPAAPLVDPRIVPRDLEPPAGTPDAVAQAREELAAVAVELPDAASRIEGLLAASDDGGVLRSSAAWVAAVAQGDAPARPSGVADVAGAALRIDAALEREAAAALVTELDRVAAATATERRRATVATVVAALAGIGTAAVLLLVHRRRRQLERQLQAAADTDPLTGIANRRALEAEVARHFGTASDAHHAVVAFDLDGFKPVNDQFGHAAGDEVLVRFAASCQQAVRDERDVAARIGGDEFVLVLFDVDPDPSRARAVARRVAADVTARLEDGIPMGGVSLHVSASSGVAVSDGSHDFAEVLGRADLELYEHKQGRERPVEVDLRDGAT